MGHAKSMEEISFRVWRRRSTLWIKEHWSFSSEDGQEDQRIRREEMGRENV